MSKSGVCKLYYINKEDVNNTMAVTTEMKIPYGIYALTNEVPSVDVTRSFDTELEIVYKKKIDDAFDTLLSIVTTEDTSFDTYLRIRSGLDRRRVALLFR